MSKENEAKKHGNPIGGRNHLSRLVLLRFFGLRCGTKFRFAITGFDGDDGPIFDCEEYAPNLDLSASQFCERALDRVQFTVPRIRNFVLEKVKNLPIKQRDREMLDFGFLIPVDGKVLNVSDVESLASDFDLSRHRLLLQNSINLRISTAIYFCRNRVSAEGDRAGFFLPCQGFQPNLNFQIGTEILIQFG